MDDFADIFPGRIGFDSAADADTLLSSVPAKGCVALLLDTAGAPLQLLCTKNLRAMLRRRLGPPEEGEAAAAPSKRVDYRALVGSIAWRRVDADFEMDLVYIQAARRAFPTRWRQLIPDRSAYFVAIDLSHPHPDFSRTTDVAAIPGAALFGPFLDRAKADRWIESARDAFDLCRYRNILVQAPTGRACAYKQMNKCPAPCDGTIPLDEYRTGVHAAVGVIASPSTLVAQLEAQMKTHAGKLEFEQAGKLKGRLSALARLCEGPNRGIRPLGAFSFVSVQPGPRKNTAKLFKVTASDVVEVAGIFNAADVEVAELSSLLDRVPDPAAGPGALPAEVVLGMVCFHLSNAKSAHRFSARSDLTTARLSELIADAAKPRKAVDESGEAIRETRVEM